MTMIWDHDHVAQRAEEREREGAREMRKLAEARAIAGPVHVDGTDSEIIVAGDGAAVATDGGEPNQVELRDGETEDDSAHASTVVDAQLEVGDKEADQSMLDVGDTVSPTDREANTTVVSIPGKTAGKHFIEEIDETVAEYFDCDPTDDVCEIVFPDRTTKDIDGLQRYPYPRSMLEIESRVHDRDDSAENGGDE